MISGPVFPRTRDGLYDLVVRHLEEVESGMVVVRTDLELEPGHVVDALARDAAGRPVFVFAVDPAGEADLASRVIATRGWLASAMPMLARAMPAPGVDYERPPRMVVLGFDVTQAALQQLAELPAGSVETYRLRPFRVGGETVVGVQPLLGAGAVGEHDSFRAPRDLPDARDQALCTTLLDHLQRLDPLIQVCGDRYSRSFRYGGELLGELRLADGTMQVRVPGPEGDLGADASLEPPWDVIDVGNQEDCVAAIDLLARRFLAQTIGELPPSPATADAGGVDGAERIADRGSCRVDHAMSFDSLRNAVGEGTELSGQEYSILGQILDDD